MLPSFLQWVPHEVPQKFAVIIIIPLKKFNFSDLMQVKVRNAHLNSHGHYSAKSVCTLNRKCPGVCPGERKQLLRRVASSIWSCTIQFLALLRRLR